MGGTSEPTKHLQDSKEISNYSQNAVAGGPHDCLPSGSCNLSPTNVDSAVWRDAVHGQHDSVRHGRLDQEDGSLETLDEEAREQTRYAVAKIAYVAASDMDLALCFKFVDRVALLALSHCHTAKSPSSSIKKRLRDAAHFTTVTSREANGLWHPRKRLSTLPPSFDDMFLRHTTMDPARLRRVLLQRQTSVVILDALIAHPPRCGRPPPLSF